MIRDEENVVNWTTDDVSKWLVENNFSRYVDLFCNQHDVDGTSLLMLTESDLRKPPLQLPVLGDIKKLMLCIWKLQKLNSESCQQLDIGVASRRPSVSPTMTTTNGSLFGELFEDEVAAINDRPGTTSRTLDPELWKTALSFMYGFLVFMLTSFVMVIVHDRVPDMNKYPPLPDIILDSLPYIPWAFELAELSALILGFMWCSILFFHKHRFILMRRMFSLSGTVFLLRCVTMLITSLSVPGIHLQCEARSYGTIQEQLKKAFVILKGLGMSLQGVRSCGDYMFSGHTVLLTLFNFFITEYCPSGLIFIHTSSWVLNLFGIFFILAAHEHYSIDVFIAFYITSRLFLYYHTLANNRSLMQRDRRRTRIWFPLFSFFESKCDGIVPNEYEWPLPWPRSFKQSFSSKRGFGTRQKYD
ncbi:sphingomyelin synthase-related protein 1-like isoform X2 [Tubulanus polymorphus]